MFPTLIRYTTQLNGYSQLAQMNLLYKRSRCSKFNINGGDVSYVCLLRCHVLLGKWVSNWVIVWLCHILLNTMQILKQNIVMHMHLCLNSIYLPCMSYKLLHLYNTHKSQSFNYGGIIKGKLVSWWGTPTTIKVEVVKGARRSFSEGVKKLWSFDCELQADWKKRSETIRSLHKGHH